MGEGPGPWEPDGEAEAAFARRVGYPSGRGAGSSFVTSWWWYALMSLQFWWHLVAWGVGDRHGSGSTGWAIGSLVALLILTTLFVLGRRRKSGT